MCKNVNIYAPAQLFKYRAKKLSTDYSRPKNSTQNLFLASRSSETLTKESYDSMLLLRHRLFEYQS